MDHFFFILGRNRDLSRAEIFTRLTASKLPFRLSEMTGEVLILEIDGSFEPASFLNHLGGTIKIGTLINTYQRGNIKQALLNTDLLNNLFPPSNRTVFGLSLYTSAATVRMLRPELLGLEIKNLLVEAGRPARWVQSRENPLSSVIVEKNKLLKKGAELVIIEKTSGELALGKTLAVQNFANYSQRDYGRPDRNMLQGMLPPKLAQIMVNLARPDRDSALLDPFCGSGTILQEALLLDYENLYGSDNNPAAIAASEKNLAWLADSYRLDISGINLKNIDVRLLNHWLTSESIDAVVTEPWLGSTRLPHSVEKIKQQFSVLQGLYQVALKSINAVLKPGGRVVIVFPCWRLAEGRFRLPMSIIPAGLSLSSYPDWVGSPPFLYDRPDQRVVREIYVLEKKKG